MSLPLSSPIIIPWQVHQLSPRGKRITMASVSTSPVHPWVHPPCLPSTIKTTTFPPSRIMIPVKHPASSPTMQTTASKDRSSSSPEKASSSKEKSTPSLIYYPMTTCPVPYLLHHIQLVLLLRLCHSPSIPHIRLTVAMDTELLLYLLLHPRQISTTQLQINLSNLHCSNIPSHFQTCQLIKICNNTIKTSSWTNLMKLSSLFNKLKLLSSPSSSRNNQTMIQHW
jgi:hypothetical protein